MYLRIFVVVLLAIPLAAGEGAAEGGFRERMLRQFHSVARKVFRSDLTIMGYTGMVQSVRTLPPRVTRPAAGSSSPAIIRRSASRAPRYSVWRTLPARKMENRADKWKTF